MNKKAIELAHESLQEATAILLRMYGLEGFARILKPQLNVDERIAKLAQIQSDLEAATDAVKRLRQNADESKQEAVELQATIERLQTDKRAAEELVKLPEEAVARLLYRASAKGRGRGLLEGILIGLSTGLLSSLLAWYLTK